MPVSPTYPGVYIEEVSSGVRTITGVSTSITAFIGRARRGPVNQPVVINNFSDFERRFGALWPESTLSFAVRDFYLNGGSTAIIVRLFNPTEEGPNRVTLAAGGLSCIAANEGAWAMRIEIVAQAPDPLLAPEIAENLGVETGDIFNLTVTDSTTGTREVFNNVTVVNSRRRIDGVLDNESTLVRVVRDAEGLPVLPASFPVPPADGTAFVVTPDPDSELVEALDGGVLTADNYIEPEGAIADHLITYVGSRLRKQGLFALEDADLVNLLCLPPFSFANDIEATVWATAAAYAAERRTFLLIDPPRAWSSVDNVLDASTGFSTITSQLGPNKKNAALFFPRLLKPNPIRENQMEDFVPSGTVAGIFARIDAQRGVWKAQAGQEASLVGVSTLSVGLTDSENGQLNPLGINCLRLRPAAGHVVWGSRTLAGNDQLASEWKYIPVRRTALFIEESLYRGTQWAVFEPNDEPLWAELRLNIGAFMQNLFRQGAFQGSSPKEAYFVKCNKETTTQNDINLGIVNVLIGFAPLKPAEFVFLKLQQIAGPL